MTQTGGPVKTNRFSQRKKSRRRLLPFFVSWSSAFGFASYVAGTFLIDGLLFGHDDMAEMRLDIIIIKKDTNQPTEASLLDVASVTVSPTSSR